MIKAIELRIGNLTSYQGRIGKVVSIDLDAEDEGMPLIGWRQGMGEVFTELEQYFGATPITLEILEKIGFHHMTGIYDEEECRNYDRSEGYSIQIGNLTYLQYVKLNGVDANTGKKTEWWEWQITKESGHLEAEFWGELKYLHQLQNLYFGLTGQELEINLSRGL